VFRISFGAFFEGVRAWLLQNEMPQQSHDVYCSTSSAFCEDFFAAWVAPFLEGIVRKPKRDGWQRILVTDA